MLRKVEFCTKGSFGPYSQVKPEGIEEGFFHGMFSEGDVDSGLNTYAQIETSTGLVLTKSTDTIRFLEPYGSLKEGDPRL